MGTFALGGLDHGDFSAPSGCPWYDNCRRWEAVGQNVLNPPPPGDPHRSYHQGYLGWVQEQQVRSGHDGRGEAQPVDRLRRRKRRGCDEGLSPRPTRERPYLGRDEESHEQATGEL